MKRKSCRPPARSLWISTATADKIKFCALNTTKARRLAISQKVLGLPVIAIYENGEMIDSCVKEDATVENVEAMIKKYV